METHTWTYIPAFLASRAHLSPRTITAYRDHLTMCARTGADTNTLVISLHARGYSPHTIASLIRDARIYIRWCIAHRFLPPDTPIPPMPRVPAPSPKAATEDDWQRMFDIANERDRLILLLLRDTGARLGALSRLRWDDIDFHRKRATVIEKGGRRAVIFLSDRLITALTTAQRISETVLNLSPSGIRQAIKRLALRAHVKGKVNPHAWRHAFVRDLLLSGCDLSRVSRIINHSRIEITARYYALWTIDDLDSAYRSYWQVDHSKSTPGVCTRAQPEGTPNRGYPSRVVQTDQHLAAITAGSDNASASETGQRSSGKARLTSSSVYREPPTVVPNGTRSRYVIPGDLDRKHGLHR